MTERLTRGKAIRAKCLDCCCGQTAEVKKCTITKCPLYRYRLGYESNEEYKHTGDCSEVQNS